MNTILDSISQEEVKSKLDKLVQEYYLQLDSYLKAEEEMVNETKEVAGFIDKKTLSKFYIFKSHLDEARNNIFLFLIDVGKRSNDVNIRKIILDRQKETM